MRMILLSAESDTSTKFMTMSLNNETKRRRLQDPAGAWLKAFSRWHPYPSDKMTLRLYTVHTKAGGE